MFLATPEDTPLNSDEPYQTLVERIREGAYAVGARLPSERALAEEFGVHRTTIQRLITRLTAEGLIDRQPGRRPIVRKSPETNVRVGIVAVVVNAGFPIVHNAYGALLLGAQTVLRSEGYRMLFLSTSANGAEMRHKTEREDLRSLLMDPVDGLIIVSEDPEGSTPILKQLCDSGTTVVCADRYVTGIETDYVGVDNEGGATAATEHLMQMGHTQIVFADTPKNRYQPAEERKQGFLSTLRRHGLDVTPGRLIEFPEEPDSKENILYLRDWLDRNGCPTGVVCVHDGVASLLGKTLGKLGLCVPEHVSIVGFDDDAEKRTVGSAQLTTIRQPFFEMGEDAAILLVNRLRRPSAPLRSIRLAPTLVTRTSTRTLL